MLFKTRFVLAAVVLSFLFCSRGWAGVLNDPAHGFTVNIPEGFLPDPGLVAKKGTFLYAFRKPAGSVLIDDPRIIIERLGGPLQRGPIRPEDLPKNFSGSLFMTRWRDFDINAARITENVGGNWILTYKAQVPLRREAIQIWTSGPLDHADQSRAMLDQMLASLNGESNWLESPVPTSVSQSIAYRIGMLVAALIAVGLGLAALLRIRRYHPRGTVLGLSCFIYAIGWAIDPGRVSELHVLVGCFRLLGVLGFVVGMVDVVKKQRGISPASGLSCPACHTRNRAGAEFCGQCGTPVDRVDRSEHSNRSAFFAKAALVSAILAALLVPVIVVLSSPPSTETAQARSAPTSPPVPEVGASVPVIPPPTTEPATPLPAENPPPTARREPPVADAKPSASTVKNVHMVQVKTPMVGGRGGGPFVTTSPTNQPVIGFEYSTGNWMGKSIIHTFTPIFPGDDGIAISHALLARPGYAVGAIEVNGDDYVRAVRVIFMRLTGGRLQPSDSYSSDWVNTPTDWTTYRLAGSGDPVVGTFGSRGLNVDGLGLVVLEAR